MTHDMINGTGPYHPIGRSARQGDLELVAFCGHHSHTNELVERRLALMVFISSSPAFQVWTR